MPSLIDELHELAKSLGWEHGTETGRIAYEAAARIAALEAQLAEARKALERIEVRTRSVPSDTAEDDKRDKYHANSIARRALEAQGGE